MTAETAFDQPPFRDEFAVIADRTNPPSTGRQCPAVLRSKWGRTLVTDRRKLWSVGPAPEGTVAGPDRLAHELSELARELHANDPDDVLREAVQAAIELVPGAQTGSVTVVAGAKRIEHKANSGALPARVDAVMSELGEGPCLDALYHRRTIRVDDMHHEVRWPRFAPRVAELGALSMLAFPMFVKDDSLGALNLYAEATHAFGDESEHVGRLLAAHSAVAYSGAQREENLLAAIETRDLIGQAVGLMMERYTITSDRAFSTLVRFSRQTNRKLRDVAAELIRDTEAGARK
jgi:transcriptional regulator with GAF, ATPase, and Fis domain